MAVRVLVVDDERLFVEALWPVLHTPVELPIETKPSTICWQSSWALNPSSPHSIRSATSLDRAQRHRRQLRRGLKCGTRYSPFS